MAEQIISIKDLRQDYKSAFLLEKDAEKNPFKQFEKWFSEAMKAQVLEPNAMTLATATKNGVPSARIVLLKGFDESGFVFFTNYSSCKGQQIAENPKAALVFFWGDLERQVRIEGDIEKISQEDSEEYFHSRPKGSQLGAIASPQSQVIPDREFLEKNLEDLTTTYQGKEIAKPDHWGGYKVVPVAFEFWQGRSNRLHDRILFSKNTDGSWKTERLAP